LDDWRFVMINSIMLLNNVAVSISRIVMKSKHGLV
jgi:hypothetical protein